MDPGRPMRCRPWDFDGPIGSKEPSFCRVSALLEWRPQEPTWSRAPLEARYSGKHPSPVFQQPVHFSETSKISYMSFGRCFIFIQGNMRVSFSSSLLHKWKHAMCTLFFFFFAICTLICLLMCLAAPSLPCSTRGLWSSSWLVGSLVVACGL